MPRITRDRQTRANPTVSSPSDYWRVTMTISFVDSILTELDTRFATDKRAHLELGVLVTELITKTKFRRNCNRQSCLNDLAPVTNVISLHKNGLTY